MAVVENSMLVVDMRRRSKLKECVVARLKRTGWSFSSWIYPEIKINRSWLQAYRYQANPRQFLYTIRQTLHYLLSLVEYITCDHHAECFNFTPKKEDKYRSGSLCMLIYVREIIKYNALKTFYLIFVVFFLKNYSEIIIVTN